MKLSGKSFRHYLGLTKIMKRKYKRDAYNRHMKQNKLQILLSVKVGKTLL